MCHGSPASRSSECAQSNVNTDVNDFVNYSDSSGSVGNTAFRRSVKSA